MKLSLLEGLDEREKTEVRASYEGAHLFRKSLIKVLQKDIESLVTNMCDEDHFKSDWPLIQASKLAELKAKRRIISLLE